MQVRLTDRDMKRVNLAQEYFSRMQPVPIQMGSADVVRVALSQLLQKLAQADTEISECSFRTRKGGRTAPHEAGSSEVQRIDALSSRPRLTRSHVETGVRVGGGSLTSRNSIWARRSWSRIRRGGAGSGCRSIPTPPTSKQSSGQARLACQACSRYARGE